MLLVKLRRLIRRGRDGWSSGSRVLCRALISSLEVWRVRMLAVRRRLILRVVHHEWD